MRGWKGGKVKRWDGGMAGGRDVGMWGYDTMRCKKFI